MYCEQHFKKTKTLKKILVTVPDHKEDQENLKTLIDRIDYRTAQMDICVQSICTPPKHGLDIKTLAKFLVNYINTLFTQHLNHKQKLYANKDKNASNTQSGRSWRSPAERSERIEFPKRLWQVVGEAAVLPRCWRVAGALTKVKQARVTWYNTISKKYPRLNDTPEKRT